MGQQREGSAWACCQKLRQQPSLERSLLSGESRSWLQPFRKACVTDRYPGTRKGEKKHLPGQERRLRHQPGIAAPRLSRDPALPLQNEINAAKVPAEQPGDGQRSDPCQRCLWAEQRLSALSLDVQNTHGRLMGRIIPELEELGCDFCPPFIHPPLSPRWQLPAPDSLSASHTFSPRSVLGFWGVRLRASDKQQKAVNYVFALSRLESPGVCAWCGRSQELTINSKQKRHYPYGTS